MPSVASRLIALANQISITAVAPACSEHTIKNQICFSRHIPHPSLFSQGSQRKEGRPPPSSPPSSPLTTTTKKEVKEAKRQRGPSRSPHPKFFS